VDKIYNNIETLPMLESSNVKEKYKTYLASHKITFNKKIFESDGDAGPAGYK
jgi:hypothetical protein